MRHFSAVLLIQLTMLAVMLAGCGQIDCGCAPPPKEPVTTAALTRVSTWYLSEVYSAGQLTQGNGIKDRYSMQFRPDGSYVQTLLSDGTEFRGTWMLMGSDNRMLHLTDHKGVDQEYTVGSVGSESLTYSHPIGGGQSEIHSFRPNR